MLSSFRLSRLVQWAHGSQDPNFHTAERIVPPFPRFITEQISTEIYELIIDFLSMDKGTLTACNLVCREWAPRSEMHLQRHFELMFCRPVHLITHEGVACAVPLSNHSAGIIYGTESGIYEGLPDGTRSSLLSIRNVSRIELLPYADLCLCLAGKTLVTIPLGILTSGTCQDVDITRVSKHASFFAVYRPTATGDNFRVCTAKSSKLTTTVKVFDVTGSPQNSTLVKSQAFYIPTETTSVSFINRTRLVVAVKDGGFEVVDLTALETVSILLPSALSLEFKMRLAPIAMLRISDTWLMCYDEVGFYVDRSGTMIRQETVMRWTLRACAFALHSPHILVFCSNHIEVWNIEIGELVQKIKGSYRLLNTPKSNDGILLASRSSGSIMEMVFNDH
ncbi:CNH domain-containing protein [Mycena filopes]|nr:CNH domain-containing protein [Mycena filopes]